MTLWRGSRRYRMAEHHSRKMAASRRLGQIGLLLLSSLTIASSQGMYQPNQRPPWTWNNGAALPPTMRKQSSTYRNGAPPHHGFTMSSAVNPMVPQRAIDPTRIYNHTQYLAANRTEGERAAMKQSHSHGEIHEGHLVTFITAGENPTSVKHHESSSTPSQRSLDALDADAANNNGQNMVAERDADPEVEAVVERAQDIPDAIKSEKVVERSQEIPDADIKSERDASAIATELSGSSDSETQTSRSDSTGSSTLTHLHIDDPHAIPSTNNSYSTKSTETGEDKSATNAEKSSADVNSEKYASELDGEQSSLDTDQHLMRRSAQATSLRNKTNVSPYLTRNSMRRLPRSSFKGTPHRYGNGPDRLTITTSAEEFMEILARLRQISQEFMDIYQEIVSHYAQKTSLKIQLLEQEISISENSDYLTQTSLASAIQYAVAKGKQIIELYHRNLNMLRLLSLKANAHRDNSPGALDDTLKATPNIGIMLYEPSSQELGQSDLDPEVDFRINGDGHTDINSPNASGDTLKIVPRVHIMLDEMSSLDLELSDLDLDVDFHIDGDVQSGTNSPDTLDDTLKTAPNVRTMLDEPRSQNLGPSDLDLEVVFHMDEDGHSDKFTISTEDTESSSASTENPENDNTEGQSDANDLIQLLRINDEDNKSQGADEIALRVDGITLPDEKNRVTLFTGTDDYDVRTLQQIKPSSLTVDIVEDRLYESAENENQTLESRSVSNEDADDQLLETPSSNEETLTEEVLGTRVLQHTSSSESAPVSDNDSILNIAEGDSVTPVVTERRLNTNASPGSGETEVAVSRQGESVRSTGKSVVSSQLVEDAPQERINDAVISGSFVKDQKINAGQLTYTNRSPLGSKNLEAHAERKNSGQKMTNATHQLLVQERKFDSQDSLDFIPAGHSGYINQGTITNKLGGRESTGRTALENEGSMDQNSRGFPGGSKAGGRSYVGNTDARAAFPGVKVPPTYPNIKYSAAGATIPVAHPSSAGSHPSLMVRVRRSTDQKTTEPPPTTNADDIPLTRSLATDETDNYGNSFDEIVARIGELSTDNDESVMIRSLGHSSINQRGVSKSKNTENNVAQTDSTENEGNSNSLPRLMVERNNAAEKNTYYTKLMDNIRDSTVLASKIKDLFERMATIPHTKKFQGLDSAGNKGTHNTSYFETKANASVRHVLSKYSTELSDILESILAKDTDTAVSRALLVYYLAKHKLLNNLLLMNVAHVAKCLNETKTRQRLSMTSRTDPAPSGVNQRPHLEELPALPKTDELPLHRLASNPPEISDRQIEVSEDVSRRNNLRMFSIVKDDTDETNRTVSIENVLFPKEEEVETIDPKTYLLPPTLPEYGSVVRQIEPEAIQNSFITSPSAVASTNHMDLNEAVNSHNANLSQRQIQYLARNNTQLSKSTTRRKPKQTTRTQNQKPFEDIISPEHRLTWHFSGIKTPQQTKPQSQQSLSTFNTEKYQTQNKGTHQQTIKPQSQQPFSTYNTLKYSSQNKGTHQQITKPQSHQPFSTDNTQKYQTPIQPQNQQLFVDYDSPQRLILQYFPERDTQQATQPQSQQPFSAYNTPKYQSPIQPNIQQGFFNYDSPQRTTSWYFPRQGTPQYASQPYIKQPLPAYNTPQHQTPLHFPQAEIQQLFSAYNSPQHQTPLYFPQSQIQQPIPAYNTPRHQTPLYFPQSQIQQPIPAYNTPQHQTLLYFPQSQIQQPIPPYNTPQHQTPLHFPQSQIQQPIPAYNTPQHQTPAYFPEAQIQQPFPGYNTPQNPTPVYFPEPLLQRLIADSLTRYFESQNVAAAHSSTSTLSEQHIGLHANTPAWATKKVGRSSDNHITPDFLIQPTTEGDQNKELVPLRFFVNEVQRTECPIIEAPTEFLQSEWLLQKLRNDYVKLLCITLIKGSENDATVDRKLYTDSFSAVTADYILRLFDNKTGRTSGNSKETTLRRRRYLSGTSRKSKRNERSEVSDDVDYRFSSDFLYQTSAATKNYYSEQLIRSLHSSDADPLFYRAFYKYCKTDTNRFLYCTPSKVEYKGPAPAEVYNILKYLALQRPIPNLCPALFA